MEIHICRDCGHEGTASDFYLTGRGKIDCICKECRRKAFRKKYEENPYKFWAINTKAYYESKGVEFYITLEELERAARIHGNCMLCGYPLYYGKKANGTKQSNSPYLDRVNSEDYIDNNNVLLVCARCHGAKKDLTLKEFLNYCKTILIRYSR
jgi:hypothetical protein